MRLPAPIAAFILSQIAARVRGYDLDPFGVWLAQTAAHFALHDLELEAGRRLPAIVHVRDSLEVRAEDRGVFDLVSSNVPFGRITLPPDRRAFYARSTYGHANLYGLFTDAGLHYATSPRRRRLCDADLDAVGPLLSIVASAVGERSAAA